MPDGERQGMESGEAKDAILDEYLETLSTLNDAQIRALVHARVPSAPERRTFESASSGVSRETLILLAAGCLARQTFKAPVVEGNPFPAWFRESPT
jgi:hypothetical protein